mgnify:CR=1 FL=1
MIRSWRIPEEFGEGTNTKQAWICCRGAAVPSAIRLFGRDERLPSCSSIISSQRAAALVRAVYVRSDLRDPLTKSESESGNPYVRLFGIELNMTYDEPVDLIYFYVIL